MSSYGTHYIGIPEHVPLPSDEHPIRISLSYFRHFREIKDKIAKQLDGPFSNSYFDLDFFMYFLQC